MSTFRGKGVLYGLSSTSLASGSVTVACSYQSTDWSGKVDEETITDCNGEVATHITKNPSQTLTVSYVFTNSTNSGTENIVCPKAGSIVTITDTSQPDAAGAWLVTSVSQKRTNSSAAVIDLSCMRYAGISYT